MPRKRRLGSTVSGVEQSRRSWSVGNLIDWHRRGEIKRNMGGGSHGGGSSTEGGGEGAWDASFPTVSTEKHCTAFLEWLSSLASILVASHKLRTRTWK